MINENLKIEKVEKKIYPPIPENIYQVELLDITVKEVPNKFKKKDSDEPNTQKVLDFQFTLLSGKDSDESDLRGRNIWRNYVPIYLYIGKNGKNVLYQIVEVMLGRDLTQEEEIGGVTDKLLNGFIGKQCRIVTKNNKKDDSVYSNIENFLKSEKEEKPLNDEEKEVARVKEKKEEVKEDTPVSVDDIPF